MTNSYPWDVNRSAVSLLVCVLSGGLCLFSCSPLPPVSQTQRTPRKRAIGPPCGRSPGPWMTMCGDSHSRDSAFGWINLSFSPLPCTQYISKTGKLSSGHSQFSFQSQRKAMPKNVLTTTQLHSSHMLVKQCLKFSMPGFKSTWTRNFQMFKLELEKAEEPAIKLPTSSGSQKK